MNIAKQTSESGCDFDGQKAWENVIASNASHWYVEKHGQRSPDCAAHRFEQKFVKPIVQPGFVIHSEDHLFCIGSCFARNVEEHLIYRGYTVSSKRLFCPKEEWPYRPNGIVNKFSTMSIVNEIRWAFGVEEFPESSLVTDKDGWRDLQLANFPRSLSWDRIIERRHQVKDYFSRLRDANVLVVTLGLVEVWYDTETKTYLNIAPSFWTVRKNPGRFVLRITNYNENLVWLEEMHMLLTKYARHDLRILMTVSPVPMGETFSLSDVIVANTYSKSTLRAVAEDFANAHDNVDYFPSFEAVTLSPRNEAYSQHDQLHVLDSAVEEVVGMFLNAYAPGSVRAFPEFDEFEYLSTNPDVDAAVRRGEVGSGYDHWLRYGHAEGRLPQIDPGRLASLSVLPDPKIP